MRTKRIIAKCEQHSGYGAGAGDTEYYEYECPCGKGTIIEEHDNIPGFREHSVYLHCTTCSKEYIIDTSAGTRNWKIVRKKVNRMKTQPYICRVHIENFRNFHSADFSLGEKPKKTTIQPNGAEVQLPPHYPRNGCRFLAKRFFYYVLRRFA